MTSSSLRRRFRRQIFPGFFSRATASPRIVNVDSLQKLLYDRRSAAAALSISIRTLDYLIARSELRTVRIGRKVLIPASELKQFARTNHYDSVACPSRGAGDASGREAA